MLTLNVDFSKKIGKIKPLHGVGGGPVTGNFIYDTTEFFRDAGFPFSRTHDIEYPYGHGEFVDIHCIFPDFDKPVDDPASYNFIFTDEYLKAIVNAGTEVFYRLGSTIEHQPIKRYIHPPKDNLKWAQICEHIIMHYNEGWADGFNMGIRYFEIWNEPDLINRCWTGTYEQFFELYKTAAKHIKSRFPNIKIGGCAVTSPRSKFTEEFIAAISEDKTVPLDFFSWHEYLSSPTRIAESSSRIKELLNKYGYTETESIYDEWNYVYKWDNTIQQSIDLHKTAKCAAFCSGVLTELQNSSTDIAIYYDAQINMSNWNGLFSELPIEVHGKPVKIKAERPYYSFKAFGELYRMGNQVQVSSDSSGIYALAARGEGECALIVARYENVNPLTQAEMSPETLKISISGISDNVKECRIIDKERSFEKIDINLDNISMSDNSVLFIRF